MTIGGTARSRLLLVAFFAILPSAVVGCATARTNTATEMTKARAASLAYPQSIRLLAEAFIVVQEQQVDAPSLRQLAPASLRGMEHLGQPGAFQVTETATGAPLTHRGPAGVTGTLELVWDAGTGLSEVLRQLDRAVLFGKEQARLGVEEINAAMIGGLVTLDAGGEYLNPRAYTDRAVGVPGIGGVGLAYTKRHQTLTVVTPFAGLPADQAGFRAGDRILEIDARPAEGLSLGEVIRLMPGSPGSTVRLTVARDGWPEPRQIELARVRIPPREVRAIDLGAGVVYVQFHEFKGATPRQLSTALASFPGMTALVLDLRTSWGGLLTSAVEVAELFLEPGKLVVHTEGRSLNQNLRFSARPAQPAPTVPMVVLMNHESGGASEVVAAALRDWGRATLVGERSPGQSLLQTYFPLADGSALRLTIARWFTSKGQRVVDGVGLTPDVEVIADTDIAPLSADPAKDNQLRRALEVLATQR